MRLKEQKLAGRFRFCENDYRYPVKPDIHYDENNEVGFRGQLTIKEDGSLLLELEGLGYEKAFFNSAQEKNRYNSPELMARHRLGRSYIILLDCYFNKNEWLWVDALKLYPKICLIQRASPGEQGLRLVYIRV